MRGFSARDRLKLLAGLAAGVTLPACTDSNGVLQPSDGPIGGEPDPKPSPSPTPTPSPSPTPVQDATLKSVYAENFKVGAAVGPAQVAEDSPDRSLILDHLTSLTAENAMKPSVIAPEAGVYNFAAADVIADFARANGLKMRGHALLWHETTPAWFLEGSLTEIRDKLETYIFDVVTRYKDVVYAWDVVNEITNTIRFVDPNTGDVFPWRFSNWYQTVGSSQFVDVAFHAARAADPEAKLFFNDFNTEDPDKMDRVIMILRELLDRGVPIDGMGHQLHFDLVTEPSLALEAIDRVDALNAGLENHVTELDISIYYDPALCFSDGLNCLPGYTNNQVDVPLRSQAFSYRELYDGFRARPSVTSVTTWGVSDEQSWLNYFPRVRDNYPLLWDRERNDKPALLAIIDPDYVIL